MSEHVHVEASDGTDSGGEAVLQVRQVEFEYRLGVPVLRKVSLTAAAGRLICVLGRNGSGNTTLLRCLLGQLRMLCMCKFLRLSL